MLCKLIAKELRVFKMTAVIKLYIILLYLTYFRNGHTSTKTIKHFVSYNHSNDIINFSIVTIGQMLSLNFTHIGLPSLYCRCR